MKEKTETISENILENKQNTKRLDAIVWIITTIACLGLLSFLIWQPKISQAMARYQDSSLAPGNATKDTGGKLPAVDLPPLSLNQNVNDKFFRELDTHTDATGQPPSNPTKYVVQGGDSVWTIVEKFYAPYIKDTTDIFRYLYTIYNNNYDVLLDAAENLKPGQELLIPPVPGIWYKWRSNDTLESVAAKFSSEPFDPTLEKGFSVSARDIAMYIGNDIDPRNPKISPGTYVMVPGGAKELINFSMTAISMDALGNKKSGFNGPGACTYTQTMFGDGYIVWPSPVHYITGNKYMPGHWGIDLGAGIGSPLYAVDDGVVSYSGWLEPGYGNFVVIDHGNGFQTLYEHLDRLGVKCGESVKQGQQIGAAGTTGNSTGGHLHFEIWYNGTHVDPFSMLP